MEIALVLPCDCEFMCIYSDYKNKQFKCYCPPNHVLAEDKLHCIGPGKLLFFYLFIVLSPSLGPMPKLFSFKQLITMSKISNDIPIIPEIWVKTSPISPNLDIPTLLIWLFYHYTNCITLFGFFWTDFQLFVLNSLLTTKFQIYTMSHQRQPFPV